MRNGTDSGTPAQSDDRDDIYQAVVADLASLIERIQASLTIIESAVARQALQPPFRTCHQCRRAGRCHATLPESGAALKACDAGVQDFPA